MKADSAICILLPLDLTILTSSILEKLRTKMLTATEVAASGTKERKTKISVKSYYRIQIYSLSRSCYICTYLPTKIFTVDSLRSKKLIPPFTAVYTNHIDDTSTLTHWAPILKLSPTLFCPLQLLGPAIGFLAGLSSCMGQIMVRE